jgi:putative transcriptional regulator
MTDSIFGELKASMKQAVDIKSGSSKTYRVTSYDVADVKAIRAKLNVTQKELANAIDVSVDTVRSWEAHRRNPTGLADKVLRMFDEEPDLYNQFAAR